MTLALLAARLAAIEALRSHPAIAAACPDRVFDGRMGEFESAAPVPTMVVTTEELEGKALSANNGGAPFRDMCDLNVEIAMTQHVVVDDMPGIFRPETDREQEAALNLLVWCAEQILTTGRPQPLARPTAGGLLVAKAIRRTLERHVTRFVSDQTGEKLAINLVKFRVELKADVPDAREVPAGEFAALPEPLRTVAQGLTSPSGLETCRMIAAQLRAPAPTFLAAAAVNPAGTSTPSPDGAVPSFTVTFGGSP